MNTQSALKKCKVSIFGESYSLITDEPEDHLQKAVHLVDSCMRDIACKTEITDTKSIAVLVALQVASKALASNNVIYKQQEYMDMLINLINSVDIN